MKITVNHKYKGLNPFESDDLPSVTIITGVNGSGKSQLLQLIQLVHLDTQGRRRAEHEGRNINDWVAVDPRASRVVTGGIGGVGPNMHGGYENERQSLRRSLEESRNPSSTHGKQQLDTIRSELGLPTNHVIGLREIDQYLRKKHLSGRRWQQGVASAIEAYFRALENASLAAFRNREYGWDDKSAMTAEEFTSAFESPYAWINRMLDKVGSPYKLQEMTATQYAEQRDKTPGNNFDPTVVDDRRGGVQVKSGDLSTGEQILMWLASLLCNASGQYKAKEDGVLLLLDECDAGLHPGMKHKYLRCLNFFAEEGVKVIATTHCPITVGLARDESIHVMERTADQTALRRTDKAEAIQKMLSPIEIGFEKEKIYLHDEMQSHERTGYEIIGMACEDILTRP